MNQQILLPTIEDLKFKLSISITDELEAAISKCLNAPSWIDYDGDVHVQGSRTCLTDDQLLKLYVWLRANYQGHEL